MLLAKNPTEERLREILDTSEQKAAKWIADPSTGDRYFWPAEKAYHQDVASLFGLKPGEYRKGLAASS